MRQLFIVKAPADFSNVTPIDKGLTSHSVEDLSALEAGAISIFELGAATSCYQSAPTKNFAIALGRPNGQRAMVIPEIDIKTLHVTKALPYAGKAFSVVFTLGTTTAGDEYTLRFFKKGVVPHERNSWTVSVVAKTNNGSYQESAALETAIKAKVNSKFDFSVSRSNGQLTITCNNVGEDWEVVAADDLVGTSLTITHGEKAIGDKKFVQELASFCAAGKGFEHTAAEGREFIPGYPEQVTAYTLNDSGANRNGSDTNNGKYSTSGYAIYTLRWQVGRDASKTRDEKVWQNLYIAIPIDGNGSYSQITTLDTILPEGDFYHNMISAEIDSDITTAAAANAGGGSGSGTGQ